MGMPGMIPLVVGLACLSLPQPSYAAFNNAPSAFLDVASAKAHTLPELGFPYDALDGIFVGSQTMHLHHDKHHAFYVNTLNTALAGSKEAGTDVEVLIRGIRKLPSNVQGAARNHGGGHLNHALFWRWLKPGGDKTPKGDLQTRITKEFGSFEKFQTAFEKAAATRFGAGWAWLVLTPDKQHLRVCSTANQDNPAMDIDIGDCQGTALLGLDVWEHAYYLDYFNLRLKYVKSFWKVANWNVVQERYDAAMADKVAQVHSAANIGHLGPLVAIVIAAWNML